jgi:hypothetical protein
MWFALGGDASLVVGVVTVRVVTVRVVTVRVVTYSLTEVWLL